MKLSDPCIGYTTTFFLACPILSYLYLRYQVRSSWLREDKELHDRIGSSTSQGFIANVATRLEANLIEETEDEDPPPSSYITHLYPSDCPNIMSAMKTLVTGFVNHPPHGQDGEGVPLISRFPELTCCAPQ
jgi:hypothetical protein